jgi:hypothetical protein
VLEYFATHTGFYPVHLGALTCRSDQYAEDPGRLLPIAALSRIRQTRSAIPSGGGGGRLEPTPHRGIEKIRAQHVHCAQHRPVVGRCAASEAGGEVVQLGARLVEHG